MYCIHGRIVENNVFWLYVHMHHFVYPITMIVIHYFLMRMSIASRFLFIYISCILGVIHEPDMDRVDHGIIHGHDTCKMCFGHAVKSSLVAIKLCTVALVLQLCIVSWKC